ncbi:protein of unknown function [Hyphomicrobium sp. 1Nfss2.1]
MSAAPPGAALFIWNAKAAAIALLQGRDSVT